MKKLIAANWKMYKTQKEAKETILELLSLINELPPKREVLICPPFTSLHVVSRELKEKQGIYLGAQNFYPATEGAYTGEISPKMLLEIGCEYALVGHSERRHIFLEQDDLLAKKVEFGINAGLKIIFCIGEKLEQRKQNKVKEVLKEQLQKGLKQVKNISLPQDKLCIAYEPVWAIGTGEVAGEQEIAQAHEIVRNELKAIFGEQGEEIRILYGGSVKPENAQSIISIDNVDGVLVGGASLSAKSFSKIIYA